jgi:ABC-type glycerol-3-phosphate transport system permease component
MNMGKSYSDRIFLIVNTIFLTVVLILALYPMIFIVSSSISERTAVIEGRVWLWPVGFSLDGYKAVFEDNRIMGGYYNSAYYMIFGTMINIVMTILAAYPLSRRQMYGRSVILKLITFTMIFSGGLIPSYIITQRLGLVNTRWALMIPGAISVWNLMLARTYLQSNIPDELLEAAQIDGGSHTRFLLSIVIPLSKPILAVLVLYYSVGHWNQFFMAFIYLNDQKMFPLQIILREILIINNIQTGAVVDVQSMNAKIGLVDLLRFSLIIVASLPLWIIYPFVQRYFVQGVMIGAIKG